ncbi:MAG: hypothetical protein KJZ83_21960 [Burkholderiaceae bacterium]|nr:hypothetical protein [Burkholderiaceae bacterium]
MTNLNIAVYGSLPLWLAGTLLFFMPAVFLCMIAFFYSCVQYVIGARIVLGMEIDDSAQFVVGAVPFSGAAMLMVAIGAGAALI